MTWLMGVTLTLLTCVVGLQVLILPALWKVLEELRVIAANLRQWDQPASLAKPGVEPGATWVVTDKEMAAMERQMTKESSQRAASPTLKPASRKRMG